MVEGIFGKILAYFNSGIRSINCILSQSEFSKMQFGSNLFYPTDWFLILDSLRTNWLWNPEGTLDQSFDLQKIAQTEDNLTNAVGPLLSNFFYDHCKEGTN